MVDEPIPFKPFITGVPEETIPQQKLSNKPTRQQLIFEGLVTDQTIVFVVPEGFFFEITSACVGVVNTSSSVIDGELTIRQLGATSGKGFISVIAATGTQENVCLSFVSPPIVESKQRIDADFKITTNNTLKFTVVGNLIQNKQRNLI